MADTENSIETEGIPEITLQLQVMDTVQAPVDDTLSVSGEAADAKATGDAINTVNSTLSAAIAFGIVLRLSKRRNMEGLSKIMLSEFRQSGSEAILLMLFIAFADKPSGSFSIPSNQSADT